MRKQTLLFVLLIVYAGQKRPFEIILRPVGKIMTDSIQSAIDMCAAAGDFLHASV